MRFFFKLLTYSRDKWVDFELEKVEPYNHNTAIYHFKLPAEDQVAGMKVASALLVKASDSKALLDDKGKAVIRPYTPISGPDAKGKLELMVKNYPVCFTHSTAYTRRHWLIFQTGR